MADNLEAIKLNFLMSCVKKFDTKSENVYESWNRWLTSFKHFTDAAKIDTEKEKKAWMLLIGGEDLQNVESFINRYYQQLQQQNFNGNVDQSTDVFAECISRLNKYFYGRNNTEKLKKIRQELNETFDKFLARLRETSTLCNFARPTEEIIKQIEIGAKNSKVRQKAQELGDIDQLIKYARAYEILEIEEKGAHRSKKETTGKDHDKVKSGRVEKTSSSRSKITREYKSDKSASPAPAEPSFNAQKTSQSGYGVQRIREYCVRCGSNSHRTGIKIGCVAWGQTCGFCNRKNHLEKSCLRKIFSKYHKKTESETSSDSSKYNDKK